jgi:putative DNA primase/helicase
MHRNNKWIGNKVSNVLKKEFKAEMKKFNGMKLIDVAKKLKATDKDMKHILSYRGAMDIVHKVSPLLEDMDFLTKMNLQPNMMPIRDRLIVDLQTGLTTQRNPEHNFTFKCPVKVDRDPTKHGLVEKFMLYICCGDKDLLDYMQVALGYSVTGQVSEKAVFVWWGKKGDNGKSTLMNLLKLILGSYCKSASKCLFIKSKSDSKLTPECEVLKDTCLAVFSETSADDALNDEVLKMASGNDPIRVNPKPSMSLGLMQNY